MGVRRRLDRWLLVLAYTMATVVAQSAHDHGPRPSITTSAIETPSDPTPQLASHAETHVATPSDHCVACRFLTEAQTHQGEPPSSSRLLSQAAHFFPAPSLRSVSIIRASSRAPPLV